MFYFSTLFFNFFFAYPYFYLLYFLLSLSLSLMCNITLFYLYSFVPFLNFTVFVF